LQAVETLDDGRKSYYIRNIFYNQEEQAVTFGNPSLFFFMVKLLLAENKQLLLQHPSEISDIISLSLANAIHLAPFSSKYSEKFYQLTLEVVYFMLENIKSANLSAVENVLNNNFLLYTCESLKNKKGNNKCTEA
jgi:hypothetical protein